MIKKDYTRCWKAADRRELHLIRLWEETALKQRLLGALLIIFIFTLLYILMVLNLLKHIESIWKPALLYLIILAGVSFVWGAIIYEDEKKLWSGRFYTRIVTCIGHTEINTRYNTSYSLDILGEEGEEGWEGEVEMEGKVVRWHAFNPAEEFHSFSPKRHEI